MTIAAPLASTDFESIVQALGDAVLVVDPNYTIQYCNPSAETMFGRNHDELVGIPLSILVPTICGPDGLVDYLQINNGQFETTVTENGHWTIPVLISMVRLQEATAFILRDLTQRKVRERKLIRSQQLGHVGSWERDIKRGVLYWSDEMFHILGIEPRDHVTVEDFLAYSVHPDDVSYLRQAIQDANGGMAYDLHYRVVRPNGEVRWVHAQGELDYTGEMPVSVIGCVKDVTEYKQSEEELRRSKDNLKLAQKLAKLGHWDWDVQNDYIFWSDETYAILGRSQNEFGGTYESFLELVHPHDRDAVHSTILSALTGEEMDIEYRFSRSNGDYCVMHVVGKVYMDETGTPIRLFGTCQDVTEKRKTEEMLIRSEKLAVVGQLAAGFAHEIRNPLTALMGFTKLFQDKASDEGKQYFEIMSEELRRIACITNELLVLAKPQSVVMKPTDIRGLVRDAVTVLAPLAAMYNVEFNLDAHGTAFVECEADQVKQVFVNIVKNGIEAMPLGGVLAIRMNRFEHVVQVEFLDEGEGIPGEVISKLGEPFYTTKPGGTGLGLMVSQKIVALHKGRMNISSEPGDGTRVVVELPIARR